MSLECLKFRYIFQCFHLLHWFGCCSCPWKYQIFFPFCDNCFLLEVIESYNDEVLLLGVVVGVVENLFFQQKNYIFTFLIAYKHNNVEFVKF
jgi:hypothetical protein